MHGAPENQTSSQIDGLGSISVHVDGRYQFMLSTLLHTVLYMHVHSSVESMRLLLGGFLLFEQYGRNGKNILHLCMVLCMSALFCAYFDSVQENDAAEMVFACNISSHVVLHPFVGFLPVCTVIILG